ncbi:MAG: hypothetical protein HOY78_12100 [Saccharothrix sp.]|nr:hypothetical protein [Saccharothrix sp.]
MAEQVFPVVVPPGGTDERFTFGLILDVAAVLKRHGFPDASGSGADFVALRQSLFRFLFSPERW